MRTKEEIDEARHVVAVGMSNHPKDSPAYTLLAGMSVALQWAAKEGGTTLALMIEVYRGRQTQDQN